MADVTARRTAAPATNGAGPGATAPGPGPSRPTTPDPRAVRVRLGSASRGADDPTLVVTPASSTATETGGTVLAQRHGAVDGQPEPASILSLDEDRHRLSVGEETSDVVVERPRAGRRGILVREVLVDGFRFEVETEPERLASLRERATRDRAGSGHAGPTEVRAVIPGRVVSVAVAQGDDVAAGTHLLVIEAMKMQNELRAPRDGTIARVGAAIGSTVEIGDLLVVIE